MNPSALALAGSSSATTAQALQIGSLPHHRGSPEAQPTAGAACCLVTLVAPILCSGYLWMPTIICLLNRECL